MPAARIQPQGRVRINRSGATQGLSASFALNGSFNAATPSGKTGSPVTSSGPTWGIGPNGYFAQGNGTGKVVTSLYASDLGISGNSPRTILTEFSVSDISEGNATLWSVGGTGVNRADFSLLRTIYRTIKLNMWGGDAEFALYSGDGVTARVFLAITYAGSSSIRLRSIAKLSTGAVVTQDQTTTLAGSLITPDTTPLTLLGGGTGGFMTATRESLSRLDIFGGRVLSDAEIDSAYRNRWQLYEGQASMLYAASAPLAYNLTSQPTTQSNASGSGVARQVHALSGAGAAQANSSASSPVVQVHALAGATSAQQNASVGGAAGQGQSLAGSPAAQSNASTSGALAQIHKPAGAAATQANAASSGAAVQAHQLAGSAAVQANSAASGSLSSVLALAGASATQSNASSAGVAGQIHALTGAPAAQTNSSTSAAVGVNGALTGANAVQANTAGTGAATQIHALSGATAAQGNAATSDALTGSSLLAAAPAAQGNAASSGAIAQVHTLGGSACGQANVAAGARVALFHLMTATASNQINLSLGGAATDLPPVVYARAPAGPGYSRPFKNTTRPHQLNTRRTR